MRLESVVLHGFKSFGHRTTVKVLPGITAIVGPNGCGKCLEGNTLVPLADGRMLPIRDLVDGALARARCVHHFDDGVAALDGDDASVLSLDPVTLKLEARPVEAFIRRSAPEFLLRIRTRSGREVSSTDYHPFFTLTERGLEVLDAGGLAVGVRIAVPRQLPFKTSNREPLAAEVLQTFWPGDRVYVPHSSELQSWLTDMARRAGGWPALARLTRVDEAELQRAEQGRAMEAATVARVGALPSSVPFEATSLQSSRRTVVRVPAEFDSRLARFLGYLIAEGRTTRTHQVWFVNSDSAVTADFGRLGRELFGLEPRDLHYKPRTTDTLFFSRTLCVLLDRAFGFRRDGKSADKVAPSQMWSASDEVIGEFLGGLFEGDAFLHTARDRGTGHAMPFVEYVTKSRRLAEDVVTLLLRLGIFPLLRPKVRYASNTRERRRRTYYAVYVYGVDQMRQLAKYVRFVGAKQRRLDAALALDVASNPNLDVVPGATELVRAAVRAGGLKVKPLKGIAPRLSAYVERRCDATRAGLLEAVELIERHGATAGAAAPLLTRLRLLAESDVHWDEIVAIERVTPSEPWVYDLTVAEHHNFVAANVIAHNSNISDAVRWTLGEQSAKTLRGQKMEDLIFHGSASHKPVGLAEVELVFSNDGTLSVPWSEIAVGRRLYRTGESEYVLNGGESRLRDILDLFAGTGANPRAYSVMDQDKLNHVLTAKPHERRVFIEEAAGIARYKQQRNETQGKLDAARQNLLRVRDVMDEVRRQLGSLERQARKAQQYKALEVERRELALTLVAADYAVLKADGDRLARELAGAGDREQGVRARIAQLAAREASQRQVILESEHRLADFRGSLQKIQSELERLLERREQMGVQVRETAEEAQRLAEEIQQSTERLAGIADDREQTSTALAEAERLVVERAVAVREIESSVERHRAGLAAERDRAEALRLEQVRIAGERTDLMRSAGELRERELQLTRRRERLASERSEAEAEGERLSAGRTAIEVARDQALADLGALRRERDEAQADLLGRETALAETEGRIAEARLTRAAKSSSLEALRQLERAREGYGAGVRAVFAEGASTPGVVGTVADLLEVPGELERAVEAVLGERLQWIVVERFEHARAAVAYLSSIHAGAATFIPLEHLPAGEPVPGDNGVSWIAGRVGARWAALARYLLDHVAVVEHLDEAEALWRKNGVVATYVTPAGEVLAPAGRLRGGGADDASGPGAHSLLARKRQIRELEEEVQALDASVWTMQATATEIAAELGGLRSRLTTLDQSIQARETARMTGEKDLEQAARELERIQRHAETVRIETGQVEAEYQNALELLSRLEQRIAAAREAEAGRESAMATLRAAIEAGQERETALVTELTAGRVEAASISERVEALRRETRRLDEMEVDLGQRLRQAQARESQVAERRVWLAEERERTDLAAREVAAERDRAEAETRLAAGHHEGLLADMRGVEQELRGVEADLRRLVESIHELELAATERRVRREELAQEAQRTYAIDESALVDRHDPDRDLAPLRGRLAELTDKLGSIGPVNLVADEEYRELDERLTFLRTQHDDLSASIKDLEKALRGMTRTAQERFLQAFEEINARFGQIFERLFEGGRAELRMVEAEEGGDPLDTGVDLMAQPRGKRLQSATLLSGGERALTGLALLFAIFYFRPSPFCILDEVDAPLDDANIHRFLRVLRELTTQTQFLVITHNRATMEAADVLYGVTMEEPGLSKLVSVNLAEAS